MYHLFFVTKKWRPETVWTNSQTKNINMLRLSQHKTKNPIPLSIRCDAKLFVCVVLKFAFSSTF